jgi:hypothetical protein
MGDGEQESKAPTCWHPGCTEPVTFADVTTHPDLSVEIEFYCAAHLPEHPEPTEDEGEPEP